MERQQTPRCTIRGCAAPATMTVRGERRGVPTLYPLCAEHAADQRRRVLALLEPVTQHLAAGGSLADAPWPDEEKAP